MPIVRLQWDYVDSTGMWTSIPLTTIKVFQASDRTVQLKQTAHGRLTCSLKALRVSSADLSVQRSVVT